MDKNMENEILQEIRKTNQNILEIKKTMNEEFEQIDKRFEQIDKRFEQIDERFEQIDEKFEQIDEKFEQIDEKFEQVDKNLKELKLTVDSINRNVIVLEEKYETRTEMLYEIFPELVNKINNNESRSIKNKFDIETIKLALRINEPKAINE